MNFLIWDNEGLKLMPQQEAIQAGHVRVTEDNFFEIGANSDKDRVFICAFQVTNDWILWDDEGEFFVLAYLALQEAGKLGNPILSAQDCLDLTMEVDNTMTIKEHVRVFLNL